MDVAVDHIQEEALSPDTEAPPASEGAASETRPRAASGDLGTEFKEAYQALSSSVWGTRLGGFFGQVRKQGESYYEGARKELDEVTAEASKGWTGLVKQTQALSTQAAQSLPSIPSASASTPTSTDSETTTRETDADYNQKPPDFLKETSQLVSRFKTEGAARLKQIQAAEDAADDALERFGTNVASWFKDAVSIAPPASGDTKTAEVLFESKDSDGKRIVHATRFDAQLHVIHSSPKSFLSDPDSPEYAPWRAEFDIEAKTDAIRKDLERYEELRRAMEKLVPEQVPYAEFWARYYFLRHVIESEEQKRRDLLRGSQAEEEEVAWDDDEEDEERSNTPAPEVEVDKQAAAGSQTPTVGAVADQTKDQDLLKPNDPRRSNEHSIADSDASYDLVSGAPSRGPESPKEEKSKSGAESDEEPDWE